ncbi:MAG: hypothetical protein NTV63_00445 [Candidatus Woesearchaeota archaeon]|nr:hypothetical protein [Candidatus Woesearchaeota archaeon]
MNMASMDRKLRISFTRTRIDIDNFKRSMSDWILFLDRNERDQKEKMRELESRIRQLEARNSMKKILYSE